MIHKRNIYLEMTPLAQARALFLGNFSYYRISEAESVPGPWPSSPPLQQFSWLETAPGQRIALLVGMAGKIGGDFSFA